MTDLSKIDRIPERETVRAAMAAEKAIRAEMAAATAPFEAERATLMKPAIDREKDIWYRQTAEATELRARHRAEMDDLRARHGLEREAGGRIDPATQARLNGLATDIAAIEDPAEERITAVWEAVEVDWLNCHDGEDAQVCALTGLPLLDGDDLLVDDDTDEKVLRAATGLAPKPKEPDEDDEDVAAMEAA